jgi:hypothetical protein
MERGPAQRVFDQLLSVGAEPELQTVHNSADLQEFEIFIDLERTPLGVLKKVIEVAEGEEDLDGVVQGKSLLRLH